MSDDIPDEKPTHIYNAKLSAAHVAQLVTSGLTLEWDDEFRREGSAEVKVILSTEDLPEADGSEFKNEHTKGSTRFKIGDERKLE